ncbi:hypothetical protein IJJ12_01935 [bacterium]|nr:hypothetical protein [bacterium]
MSEPHFLTDAQLQEVLTAQTAATTGDLVPVGADGAPLLPNSPDLSGLQEELLFSWVSPERPFRPRTSPHYRRNLWLLLALIVLLLIFLNQLALLIVALSLIFMGFVLANVPPRKIRHYITNYGIYTGDRFYSWLGRGRRFWWEMAHGQEELIFETAGFPYRVVLMVGHQRNHEHLRQIMSHYFIEQKPAPTDIDRLIAWWHRTFPLE